jgi:hypothetical protein
LHNPWRGRAITDARIAILDNHLIQRNRNLHIEKLRRFLDHRDNAAAMGFSRVGRTRHADDL